MTDKEGLGVKLTDMQLKAAKLIASRNANGMGARMPYAEMIVAADELVDLGLAEWRDENPSAGRWLSDAGRQALSEAQQ